MDFNKPGFSLLEVLIGLAVSAIILVIVASTHQTFFRFYYNQNSFINAANENRQAFDEITDQIRQSQAIASTCTACGGDTTGPTILILQLWPLDSNGNSQDPGAANYDYIEYKQNSQQQLIRQTFPSVSSSRQPGTRIVSSGIFNLAFSYLDNYDNVVSPTSSSQVAASITTSQTTIFGKTLSTTKSVKVGLRNK